ncbi:hypothetical protein N072000002_18360 [Clostridium tetani]|uniref:Phage tail tape measure protein n=1 Tax=Clostridium tetani TaxID=1513 RepID=A0ABC8EDP1_CLOTA|nr:hypothetical protein [Clostridium tetani]BDR81653.1 hypothetical protein K234311028_18990 [Clostridium tetani]BDR90035.1 hypothetical protein N072000002_18360 [Clostridium tetani]
MIEKVSGAIQILAEKFNNLTPAQADMIVKIGLMVAALGPVISIVGKLISTGGTLVSTIGKVSTAFGKAGGASAVLGKAFTALKSPIGIAVIAIGTVITIGVALYKNWDTIKAKAAELKKAISEKWNKIKQVTVAVFTSIKDFFNNIWNGIKTAITTPINLARDIVKKAVDSIYGFFKNLRIPEIRILK